MSKYFYRIFTIIDLHFGAMQPCSSGLEMTLEASDFRSVRRLVAYSAGGQPRGSVLEKLTWCMPHELDWYSVHFTLLLFFISQIG